MAHGSLRDPRSRQTHIRMQHRHHSGHRHPKGPHEKPGARGGKPLGEIEEGFAATSLTKGDTFLIGGQIVRYRRPASEMTVEVTRDAGEKAPKSRHLQWVTKFATSTQLIGPHS